MSPEQTHKKFVKIVESEGTTKVAARLGCYVAQVSCIVSGKRNPGMRVARAIQEIYEIKMEDWVEAPKVETIKRIA